MIEVVDVVFWLSFSIAPHTAMSVSHAGVVTKYDTACVGKMARTSVARAFGNSALRVVSSLHHNQIGYCDNATNQNVCIGTNHPQSPTRLITLDGWREYTNTKYNTIGRVANDATESQLATENLLI